MKFKRLVYVLIISLVLIISGCSSNKSQSNLTTESMPQFTDGAMDDIVPEEFHEEGEYDYGQIEPDKIITTVSITMQTVDFTETVDKLNSLIGKHKGYIESSDISYNNYVYSTGLKHSNYSIRIPRENLLNFKSELKDIGNIISESTSKLDITKQYRDTESRLKVLQVKEERILELLQKADKMEDIIALENQLSNIIYDKENYSASLMNMDDKVNYSTVEFYLDEVAKLSPSDSVKTPFSTKVINAFKNSLYLFALNVENFIISFIYFIPTGIILGIIIFVLWKVKKKRNFKFKFKNKNPKE